MIRETLAAGANHVYLFDYYSSLMSERTRYQSVGSGTLPYSIKLRRSGNMFTL